MFRNLSVKVARVLKRVTSISHDQSTFGLTMLGAVSKAQVNAADTHPGTGKWIGQPEVVHAPPGTAFGKPTNAGNEATLWKSKPKATMADTSPKRKSLIPSKDGAPPNPGRPEFGKGEREYK